MSARYRIVRTDGTTDGLAACASGEHATFATEAEAWREADAAFADDPAGDPRTWLRVVEVHEPTLPGRWPCMGLRDPGDGRGDAVRMDLQREDRTFDPEFRIIVGEHGSEQGHVVNVDGAGTLADARRVLDRELRAYGGDGWGRIEYTCPTMSGWDTWERAL